VGRHFKIFVRWVKKLKYFRDDNECRAVILSVKFFISSLIFRFIVILLFRCLLPLAHNEQRLLFGGDFTTEFSTKNKGFNMHVTVIRSTAPPLTANACYALGVSQLHYSFIIFFVLLLSYLFLQVFVLPYQNFVVKPSFSNNSFKNSSFVKNISISDFALIQAPNCKASKVLKFVKPYF